MSDKRRDNTSGGRELGWKVHGLLDGWTGKVDTKASIVLAIELAVVGFIISLSENEGQLSGLQDQDLWIYRVGITLLVLAAALAVMVVFPQLRRARTKKDWQTNTIYFGHLRFWDPEDLAKELEKGSPGTAQLATQLVAMSKIAWRKHVWLQGSVVALVAGCIAVLIAAT